MGWWRETINIVKENDPAARTSLEVLLTYPGVKALAAHRVSHFLWNHGFKLLARMHSQFWRFWTQIEIHPGATIASGVFIDHGAGLVIGETAIVEKGVMLYHGVTLGGTGKDVGKRHPTVREGALVSAHAQVIGPIEIGAKAKVGAGAVVVSDVPSDVTVVGVPAKIVRVHGRKDGTAPGQGRFGGQRDLYGFQRRKRLFHYPKGKLHLFEYRQPYRQRGRKKGRAGNCRPFECSRGRL